MRTKLNYAALALALVTVGWLAGSRQSVDAQGVIGGTWSMSVGSLGIWMYHSRTGEIRRVVLRCGNTSSACAYVVPVLDD